MSLFKNEIVVHPAHDYESEPEGGHNALHRVYYCNVDREKGLLVWDHRFFPSGIVDPSNPRTVHVKDLQIVGEDVLTLLRQRGINVTELKKEQTA